MRSLDIKAFFGLAIIFIGIMLFLDNVGLGLGVDLFDFWPVFLIAIGANQLINGHKTGQSFSGWLFLIAGVLFLLRTLDFVYFRVFELWPFVLIAIGIAILKNHFWKGEKTDLSGDHIHLDMILGGGDQVFTSRQLTGGKITAIMGGGTVDLRQAEMSGDEMVIDTFAFWGGIEIRVPRHWQVNLKGTPLLGGMENVTEAPEPETTAASLKPRKLTITGAAIMGGVEIKN